MQTTVGQILVNEILPDDLKDYARVLDKKGVRSLLEQVADRKDPDLYRTVVHALHKTGVDAAQAAGSSFSLNDFRTPPKTKFMMDALKGKINEVVENDSIDSKSKHIAIQNMVRNATPVIERTMMDEVKAAGNPFATQVISGSRGGVADLRSLLVGDMLVVDHKDRVLPIPVTSSFSSGISPAEFWAGAYGARKGGIATKLSTQKAGFLGKQLLQAAHRQVITEHNCGTDRGIPVMSDDEDNIGTLLAQPVGDMPAGTAIDQRNVKKINAALKDAKDKTIYVRSPITCEAKQGVCSRCAGVREHGFPAIGDNVGIAAAQSLSERLSQTTLGTKHGGGRAKGHEVEGDLVGFPLINQIVQVPKAFRGGAAVASTDGTVKEIKESPSGGSIITIGDTEHFSPKGATVNVKAGDRVEAGDVMSEGLPNPAELVRHRGIGAGRVDFMNIFRDAYKKSGLSANRRNIEILTRGLVNHVRVNELDGVDDAIPDDLVEFSSLERNYKPRYGFRVSKPSASVGTYLEKPALHYSVGTRVTNRVAKDMDSRGIKDIHVHADPPPFGPEMVRGMEQLSTTPDWQVRLGGSYLERGMLEALHRGRGSELKGVSYIPALARGATFGDKLKTEGLY